MRERMLEQPEIPKLKADNFLEGPERLAEAANLSRSGFVEVARDEIAGRGGLTARHAHPELGGAHSEWKHRRRERRGDDRVNGVRVEQTPHHLDFDRGMAAEDLRQRPWAGITMDHPR